LIGQATIFFNKAPFRKFGGSADPALFQTSSIAPVLS
jgi:hypothetical protein